MNEKLGRFPLLGELIDSERGVLAEFLTERELDAGSTLFRTNEEAEELYFVTRGTLAIKTDGQSVGELGAVMPLSERKRSVYQQIPPGGNWRSLPEAIRRHLARNKAP